MIPRKLSAIVISATQPLARRLADLGVGKKLLLIYLLDLCTVIFISSILIHEKYIAMISRARNSQATPTSRLCGRPSLPSAEAGRRPT